MKSLFQKSCIIELILILLGWLYPIFMPTPDMNIKLNGNGLVYLPWFMVLVAIIAVPIWGLAEIYIHNQVHKKVNQIKNKQ